MIGGKTILVVVPARGGSKGIKLKNLVKFRGKPLIVWAAEIITTLDYIDRSVVSTDHPEIARVAVNHGLASPFVRPPELSGDLVSDVEVLTHTLNTMEIFDACTYDVVLMLQPTSPMRTVEHIKSTVEAVAIDNYDSALTVGQTPLKYHPLKQLTIVDYSQICYFCAEGESIIARQQLVPTYHRNGAAYAISRDCLVNQKTIIGENAKGIVIKENLVNIDSLEDLAEK